MSPESKQELDVLSTEVVSILEDADTDGKKILILGPDAYAISNNSTLESNYKNLYDYYIKELLDANTVQGHSIKKEDYHKYDIFLATELWAKSGTKRDSEISFKYSEIYEKYRESDYPIIDMVAQLPFDIYISLGFDEILHQKLIQYGRLPQELIFANGNLKKTKRKSSDQEATFENPLIGNIFGNIKKSSLINTYEKLSKLIQKTALEGFCDDVTKLDISDGKIFFIGIQLFHWYTGFLLHPFILNNMSNSSEFCEFHKQKFNQSTEEAISMYIEKTGGIVAKKYDCVEINQLLIRILSKLKVSRVFISYRHHIDNHHMQDIRIKLRDAKYFPVTSSEFERNAGEKWEDIRTARILESKCMIACLTNDLHQNRDSDCYNEIEIAIQHNIPIIAITYDSIDVTSKFPKLADSQVISANEFNKIDEDNLLNSLNNICRIVSND